MLKFKDKPLDFEPGAKWIYSNSGYILLALILEKASGVGYAAYLEENIFGPLGMKDSGHDEWAPVLKNRATGYSGTGDAMVHAPYHDMSIPIGGGDLYSTVEDLLLWDQALYGEKVLSRKSIDRMFTPVLNNYGYGWSIRTHNGRKVINHAGGINGFVTFIARYPEQKIFLAVLSNNSSALVRDVAQAMAGYALGDK